MSVRKNMLSLLASQVLTWVISLVLLVVAPDSLGDEGFGTLSYSVAFVTFFTLIASLGTGTLLNREIARDHELLRPWVHNAVVMKTGILVVLSTVAMLVAVALGNRGDTLVLIAVGLVGMAFVIYNEVFQGALAGMEVMAKPAAFQVVQVYVATGLGLLALVLDWGLIAYGSVFSLASVIPFVGNRWLLGRYLHGEHQHMDPDIWRLLVRGGIPLMALSFFNLIYGTVDVPILGVISGEDTVAWYALALRWVGIPVFIVTAVVAAYFPRMSAHGKARSPEFAALVNRAVRLVLVVTLPAAVGLAFVADDLIAAFYTAQYQPSVALIQILSVWLPIGVMDTILATALVASDRTNKYIVVSAIASVVNPVACVVLIHWAERNYDNGAIGAAIVTVGTELLVMTGALLLRSEGVLDRAALLDSARILVASAAMVPVLLVARDLPLVIQIACGIAAYGVAALVFRVTTLDEVRGFLRSTVESATSRRHQVPETVE